MGEIKSGESWDREFGAGKYAFLHTSAEKARLVEIAAMIGRSIVAKGACEVVDIGCGEGLLLGYLPEPEIIRYAGVDISAVALSHLPASSIPVTRRRASLADWDGDPPTEGRRVVVASEVLYYVPDAVDHLESVAAETADEVIVSCVSGNEAKPNWTAASQKLWRDLATTNWKCLEERTLYDEARGIGWDIARYDV